MSRIEELIKEKCPDGVEYRTIESVIKLMQPKIKVKSNDYLQCGKYPVIDQGKEFIGGYTNEETPFLKDEYVIFGDHTCVVKYVNFEFVQGADGVKVLKADKMVILPRYLYHCMTAIKMVVDYARHWSKMKVEEIPVPPIEVQQEIVRILDKFTEIEAELQVELDSRKKQYEYYREELLSKGIPVMLSEVATYVKDRVNATEINASNYVGVDNILQNRAGKKDSEHYPTEGKTGAYKPNDVLIGNIRPYLKKIWFANCNGGTNGDVLVIRSLDEEKLLPEYLYHMLSSDRFFDYDTSFSKGGKMPRGDKEAIMKYQMMLPSVCEQRQIVDILNRFKDICSDVSNGLPAEIEARHKQYEYYRDKLLTFERKEV